ncbi:chitooligosaccharidolytic beta-N-acetylglucosaminidase [Aedes albopictus]|uniref:Beta-hexosaminidase n=1 Tax=Aedes albopictus TaxID=7160 RepID=A0ABM1Y517_AEDAL|nr:chitooligosaccharidolytic beta-N-acetylglucosaminidase-like [Aedes albopictus]
MRTVTSEVQSQLLAVIVVVIVAGCFELSFGSPLYKYRCVRDKCLRQQKDSLKDHEQYLDSLNECRLVCGEFRALWPIPAVVVNLGQETREFVPSDIKFDFHTSPDDADVQNYLNQTTRVFLKNLYKECGRNCNRTTNTRIYFSVKVETTETSLTWTTDESYDLFVEDHEGLLEISIVAPTVFGARHGLETVSQLTALRTYPDGNCLLILTSVNLKDYPHYPHRGLLLDTARNFIPIRAIQRQLDGMASTKLNVLHWHITDSQSFPLEMPSLPLMTKYGAYSEKQIYTQQDVRSVFEYAKLRGIRVLLEFDAPAHAGNGWQWAPAAGFGSLAVCVNQQPWRKLCIEPPCGQLNPANPHLYPTLQKLYADFSGLIPPQEILHMGGDEVFFGCWNATREVVDYLEGQGKSRGEDDFLDLWGEFQANVLRLWDQQRQGLEQLQPTILWSSHLTDPAVIEKYLPKERYVVQTWVESDKDLPLQLVRKGYRLIVSTKNAWYFDHGFWGVTNYYNWRKVYNNKLLKSTKVLGGEACIWTEFIDENSLDSRTWPRLAAVGERLWANPLQDASKAEGRFYRHRERLITRGLRPEAVAPKWCEQNEGECQ